MNININSLNKKPYAFLTKTNFFKEEIENFHFVARILLEKKKQIEELAYLSKGFIQDNWKYKIDVYDEDISILNWEFTKATQFKEDFNQLIRNIKTKYSNTDTLIIDVNDDNVESSLFLKFLKETLIDIDFITYSEYLEKKVGIQEKIDFDSKVIEEAKIIKNLQSEQPEKNENKPNITTNRTLDLFSFSEENEEKTLIKPINNDLYYLVDSEDKSRFNVKRKFDDNINALNTLKLLLSEKRSQASDEEKDLLSKYVGFGGLKEISFDPTNENQWNPSTSRYKEQVNSVINITIELDALLGTNNTLSQIRAGILNAHYTNSEIIKSIYKGIEQIGFKSGAILEPSGGIGNFIGNMPPNIREKSNINLVEIDTIPSLISEYLYNDIKVKNIGYQDTKFAKNSQDLIISNVPFGSSGVYDSEFKGDKSYLTNKIHNYFFAKSLDHAKEGGLIVLITSKGLLDSKGNQNIREYINDNADFLGAVRLNDNAFFDSANTKVVTDIIFLRKNTLKEKSNINFIDVKEIEIKNDDNQNYHVNINNYFTICEENILGKIIPGGLYNNNDYTVVPYQWGLKDLEKTISLTLKNYTNSFHTSDTIINYENIDNEKEILARTKELNLVVVKNNVYVKSNDQLIQQNLPKYISLDSIKNYIELRDVLMNLIQAEYNNSSDLFLNKLRAELNTLYDKSGLNKSNSKQLIKEWEKIIDFDGDGITVRTLTNKDGQKADILFKKTISPNIIKDRVETVQEAVLISLQKHAKIEIETLKELLQKNEDDILELSKGLLFKDPLDNYFIREDYLSGNVKRKLAEAKLAFDNGNKSMKINIEELELVIPKDIPIHEIEVRMGSRWVPDHIYQKFAREILKDDNLQLNFYESLDSYSISGKGDTVEAYQIYGTRRRNALKIIIDALHMKAPVIFDKDINDKMVINKVETEKAVEKYEEVRELFIDWIYKEEDRRIELEKLYNQKFNNIVKPTYSGEHLSIPGINNVILNPHQKDAIWMNLKNNGGIVDHIVGSGKTYIIIAGAMEMKRTGVANKPLIIGLKSTIPQIVETFKNAYPLSNILSPTDTDFNTKNRQLFLSKIALNNYDAVIMSHEQFAKIPHENEFEQQMLFEELLEVQNERNNIENKKDSALFENRIKEIEKRIKNLQDIKRDNIITFQKMGIDHIMVDESQQFKNLAYSTKQNNIAGLSKPSGSKRAFNLLMACRTLQERYKADKGISFFSGTPISNSIVEMYTLFKYLRPNILQEKGINTFDQWASTYASPSNEIEYTVTGEFKSKTRFREFINLPELSMLYNEIADVRNDYNLILDKPRMLGGDYIAEIIPISEEQKEYALNLINFAKTKDPSYINKIFNDSQLQAYMLIVTNLAAKMSIDMRLIDKNYNYNPNGKIAKLVDKCYDIYNNTSDNKGTQLIFCDIGTPKGNKSFGPVLLDYLEDQMNIDSDTLEQIFGNYQASTFKHKSKNLIIDNLKNILELNDIEIQSIIEEANNSIEDFNLYDEIKHRLVLKGIQEGDIAFIHSYNSKTQKENLYEKVNNGEIRILLGSTQKLGTGVNVQHRIAGIHHLDAPWRPSDMIQRDGRGLRQWNWIAKTFLNNEIPVSIYATVNTLDTYKYQLLKTKNTFINQIKLGNLSERTVKEASIDGAESFARIMAELTGNQTILTKFRLEAQRDKLVRAEKNFNGMLFDAQANISRIEESINSIKYNIEKTVEDLHFFESKNKFKTELVENFDGALIEKIKLQITTINDNILLHSEEDKKQIENIDYVKKMIQIINEKLDFNNYQENSNYTDIVKFNGIELKGTIDEILISNNDVLHKTNQRLLSIKGISGNFYQLNYSSIPGVLLNNLTSTFNNINSTLEKQRKLLDKKVIDLKAYQEIIETGVFPKKNELNQILADIKKIDKELKAKENDTQELENANSILIDSIYYPNHTNEVPISIVKGIDSETNQDKYLVRINIEFAYHKIWKMSIEPMFESLDGKWNKKHKSIIFDDYNNLTEFINYIKENYNLESNILDIDIDSNNSTSLVEESIDLFMYNSDKSNDSKYLATNANYLDEEQTIVTVQSKYNEHNYLNFYSKDTKINNAEDVAFIMSALQNKSIEHMYAIHIDKNGHHHTQFISIGNNVSTVCNDEALISAALMLNTQKIYLVHNHPSGNLNPSKNDLEITKLLNNKLKYLNIGLEHLIINTFKKAYTLLNIDNYNKITTSELYYDNNEYLKKEENKIIPFINNEIEFYRKPLSDQILDSRILFNFIQNLRFSMQPKYGLLVLSSSNHIIANYILKDIEDKDIIKKTLDTGIGKGIVFYTNQNVVEIKNQLIKLKKNLEKFNIKFLDSVFVSYETNNDVKEYYSEKTNSAIADILSETKVKYNTGDNKFENQIKIETYKKWNKLKAHNDIIEAKKNTNIEAKNNSIENITIRKNRLK